MLRTGLIAARGGVVVAPSFDPLTLGLWTWAKASEETTYADGDPAEATDLTGNGHPLLQATSSKRPLYKTGILDGKAVWRFDGIDDLLTTASVTLNTPIHYVLVCRFRAGYSAAFPRITDSKNPIYYGSFFRNSSTQMGMYASVAADPMITTTPESWHWYEYLWDGASSRLTVDGGSLDTGNPGLTGNHGGVTVGARGDGLQEHSEIDVAELMVRDSAFTSGELTDIASYMAAEYPSI